MSNLGDEMACPGVDFTGGYGRCVPHIGAHGETYWVEHSGGLTKRELFALTILPHIYNMDVKKAIAKADELLEELRR